MLFVPGCLFLPVCIPVWLCILKWSCVHVCLCIDESCPCAPRVSVCASCVGVRLVCRCAPRVSVCTSCVGVHLVCRCAPRCIGVRLMCWCGCMDLWFLQCALFVKLSKIYLILFHKKYTLWTSQVFYCTSLNVVYCLFLVYWFKKMTEVDVLD